MKQARWSVVLAAITALAMTGCGHEEGDGHAHEAEPGISFQAKYGLLVTPTTARFIGLEVADVEERKIKSTLEFSAQIYRAVSGAQFASNLTSALASGMVSATQAALLREGQPVSVPVTGADPLVGRVVGLNCGLEKTAGQVEVLLAVDDFQGRLTRGAFVSVAATLGGDKSVVSVPRSGLLRTTEGDFVYTLSGDRFVRAAVKLGVVNHEFAEVTDGLLDGDKIVVRPVMTLWLAELQSIRGGKACADGH